MNIAEPITMSHALKLNALRAHNIDYSIMRGLTGKTCPPGSALWCVLHISYGNTHAENQALIKDVLGWREGKAA